MSGCGPRLPKSGSAASRQLYGVHRRAADAFGKAAHDPLQNLLDQRLVRFRAVELSCCQPDLKLFRHDLDSQIRLLSSNNARMDQRPTMYWPAAIMSGSSAPPVLRSRSVVGGTSDRFALAANFRV